MLSLMGDIDKKDILRVQQMGLTPRVPEKG